MVRLLRYTARTILLLFAGLAFVFALLSGAEQEGGGLMGVIRNSPNAVPWVLLLGLVYVAWRWELIGGIIVIAFGVVAVFFFNLLEQGLLPLVLIGLAPIVLGSMFVVAHFLDKNKTKAVEEISRD